MKFIKAVSVLLTAGILFFGCQNAAEQHAPSESSTPAPLGAGTPSPEGHSGEVDLGAAHSGAAKPAAEAIQAGSFEKAKDGYTVEELFTKKAELSGKTVNVRGKVTKYNPGIMGSNWIHLQDGSGSAGTNDITVTTQAEANVGDKVLISGTLATDKDFGYNYKYDVIIEDAKVTVE